MILLQLQVIPLIKGKLPVKGKREVRKHANWLKKTELNAKRRKSYQPKKNEREAARNNTENLNIIFFPNLTHAWVS